MAQSDHQDEFSELLATYRSQIYGYILALVMRTDDADDVFQTTSLVMWKKFDQFDQSTNFLSWACRTAFFEVRNYVRRRKDVDTEHFSQLLNAFAVDTYVGQRTSSRPSALSECVAKLSKADRELLDLVYRDGHTVTRVAELLSRSRKSVSNSLSRIRRGLGECVRRVLARESDV